MSAYLENPLAGGLGQYRNIEPALMVIFGATGDLSRRKLLPALYTLSHNRLLPPGFLLVGAALDDLSERGFRELAAATVRDHSRTGLVDEESLDAFCQELTYQRVDFQDREAFVGLRNRLAELDRERHAGGNIVFYCATPPPTYPQIVRQLEDVGLSRSDVGYRRIIVEKPFGSDLTSAMALNRVLGSVFPEESVYRIDHYLGKETVQNIFAFRFANAIFEPIWNTRFVDHVQITVAEPIGIEKRASYYEQSGALRDIIQNHAFQLLSVIAMEPPVSFDATSVRDEKLKVLKAVRRLRDDQVATHTVRAQYRAGMIDGEEVAGYRQERGVVPDSATETFAALRLKVDNWRWADVPFYIRTGKRLARQATEIRIQFKRPPHLTFGQEQTKELEPNSITVRIQPEEGIALRFGAKVPSAGVVIRSVNMDFTYSSAFLVDTPDAYERLLLDCMVGDPTLFTRSDEVELAWSLIDPIEAAWRENRPPLSSYEAGSWGPEEADRLIEADGRRWHNQ
ncbi:MAG TPA: glucose-6-phosphate dehydrogenase [Candidatus Dormibacteraeota bacterium]|nr:glucose-6-phosphate dehydrogenase [Candidatus Dormibacteraeota bacterium]